MSDRTTTTRKKRKPKADVEAEAIGRLFIRPEHLKGAKIHWPKCSLSDPPKKTKPLPPYRVLPQVTDEPLNWCVLDAEGNFVCETEDGTNARRIAAALNARYRIKGSGRVAIEASAKSKGELKRE